MSFGPFLCYHLNLISLMTNILDTVQDFLNKLGIKPCIYVVERSIFFTKSFHHQTYQNYKQPPQTSQNSDFQSHFSVFKISQTFPF